MGELVSYHWRGDLTDDEMAELAVSAGGNPEKGLWDRIRSHSLGWATARASDGRLVGYVNVAWDGGRHAFLLDPMTRDEFRHRGIASKLVEMAVHGAEAAGCEWLHVDFPDVLAKFYLVACAFQRTAAGLIRLHPIES